MGTNLNINVPKPRTLIKENIKNKIFTCTIKIALVDTLIIHKGICTWQITTLFRNNFTPTYQR